MYTNRILYRPLKHLTSCPPTLSRALRTSKPNRKMSLLKQSPNGAFPSLTRTMNDLESILSHPLGSNEMFGRYPSFDVRETKDSYCLDGDLPGVDKNDVQLELSDDNVLTVKGHSERESVSEDPEQSWWCSERAMGDFRRSFSLPTPVDREHITATMKDGVISITVPKTGESSTSKRIDIK
ncbi:HSP20-like chaperone [Aspergillus californicus]